MYRLFVAVDLPEEVTAMVRGISRGLTGARWVPEEQLHLTLRFIGAADESTFQAVKESLGRIKAASFSLALNGVGHFPPGKRGRVLWVGMEPSRPLHELQGTVETALVEAGIPPEERPFAPHITLARFREPVSGELARFEELHRDFVSSPFPVTAFYLYSSILAREGAIHRREGTYPLTAES